MSSSRTAFLADLVRSLPWVGPFAENPRIHGIAYDSRMVKPGYLFVALEGGSVDGHRYIPQAIERGASAIVGTKRIELADVPYVPVDDGRQALALLSAAFYGFPSRQLTVIGVTGTDGKTTTSNLIFQVLLAAGHRVGMISTVNAVIGERVLDTGFHVTTPEAPDVQRYLLEMVEAGLSYVVLEATSHGLVQQRVAAVEFDVGVVTNITHEHLDYHGSYEDYRFAKSILFRMLGQRGEKPDSIEPAAVLNQDDQSFEYLSEIRVPRQISYGRSAGADVRAYNVEAKLGGLSFRVDAADSEFSIDLPLLGAYNVYNALAAVATGVVVLELPVEAVQRGIASLAGVPGRMERIDMGQDFIAVVDFAHTPNALVKALTSARDLAGDRRVIAVFGSAGLRDRAKRWMMAENAIELADLTVLTAEDPRTESLAVILDEMAQGARAKGGVEGKNFWRVPDRGDAIRFAIGLAKPGDLVIACGKGHEQSMCFGDVEYLWDDRTAMRAALSEHLGIEGPEMPYLPTQDRDTG